MNQITRNFHLSEFIDSDYAARHGIDNTPSASIVATLTNILIPSMQTVRDLLGAPVVITSGYRCPELNVAIGGSPNSDHMTGHACDFRSRAFGTPRQVAAFLAEKMAELRFDQLIFEGSWVHISFGTRLRNQVLTAHFTGAGVRYTQGIA